jgi:hypothetical protein
VVVVAEMAINNDNHELPPFFVSHAGSDNEIRDIILEVFRHHNRWHRMRRRPPIVVDNEMLARSPDPYWEQIRNMIQRESDAVFLILTRGITEQEHTQNWVAFEIGIAAGHNPPIPVIAVSGEGVTIPIPYVNHYYSYSSTFSPRPGDQENRQRLENRFFNVMNPMISDPHNYHPLPLFRQCTNCNLQYHHHSLGEQPLLCPCCSRETFHVPALP